MNAERKHLESHAHSLNSDFPKGECSISGNTLTWIGELSPTYLTKVYKVKIEYKAFERPRVKILTLGLRIPVIKTDIHMFKDSSLCLYHNKEWNYNKELAKSIIPWICEWLYFYEVWLVTHKWCGSGIHIEDPDCPFLRLRMKKQISDTNLFMPQPLLDKRLLFRVCQGRNLKRILR